MTQETAIKLFEGKQIRSVWNDEDQKWYFSVADMIEALTGRRLAPQVPVPLALLFEEV